MSAVTIRLARAERDAARVLSIYEPYIRQTAVTFDYEVPDAADFARRMEEIARDYPYLILEIDGEAAGFAYAHRQGEKAAFAWNAELTVYLAGRWCGRGVGEPLYALLIRLLRMQGYVNLYAVITGSNAASLAMHEKMGFSRAGVHERTGYKFGQWHDTVWMHLRVNEGAPGCILRLEELDAHALAAQMEKAQEEIQDALCRGKARMGSRKAR